jgi:hypothetical protein
MTDQEVLDYCRRRLEVVDDRMPSPPKWTVRDFAMFSLLFRLADQSNKEAKK